MERRVYGGECTPVEEAMNAAELCNIQNYSSWWQATIEEYIQTRTIY